MVVIRENLRLLVVQIRNFLLSRIFCSEERAYGHQASFLFSFEDTYTYTTLTAKSLLSTIFRSSAKLWRPGIYCNAKRAPFDWSTFHPPTRPPAVQVSTWPPPKMRQVLRTAAAAAVPRTIHQSIQRRLRSVGPRGRTDMVCGCDAPGTRINENADFFIFQMQQM